MKLQIQKGKIYTGDELEQLGYSIDPDETRPYGRHYIATLYDKDGNIKDQYLLNDVGNDCYSVVSEIYKVKS
jgi:hypothetical protein